MSNELEPTEIDVVLAQFAECDVVWIRGHVERRGEVFRPELVLSVDEAVGLIGKILFALSTPRR